MGQRDGARKNPASAATTSGMTLPPVVLLARSTPGIAQAGITPSGQAAHCIRSPRAMLL
jgi:hypothetical protein